jgi:hypothetical protein
MRRCTVTLAVALVLFGWTAVGWAAPGGRHSPGGAHGGTTVHGGGSAFHGRRGDFHGGHGGHRFHGHPGFHGHAFIGVSPLWWGPSYVYAPPPVYSQPAPWGYWYYCPSAGAYYPYVQSCPESWVAVPAR